MYWWLLRENGDIGMTAGKTREEAERRAASWVYHFNEGVSFIGPDGETGRIEPEQVFSIDPSPGTKKTFKSKVRGGIIFRAVGCETSGTVFVGSPASLHGSSWVARVEVNEGYIRKVIK